MRASSVVFLGILSLTTTLFGNETVNQARLLEQRGEAAQARLLLQRATEKAPADPATLTAYAEFLDRYDDPGARPAYEKLLGLLRDSGNTEAQVPVARRLVLLTLLAGDREAAARHLRQYREAGGRDWPEAALDGRVEPPKPRATVKIPGPFDSFARMAAISREVDPDDMLPALARNVVTSGYRATGGTEALDQTEYLKLLIRYVSQARELETLAGPDGKIRIETCDSPETGDLLRVLGYRMRGSCGSEVVLETVNATRAFLTIDSGFPLAELEEDLRTNRPFVYDFSPNETAVLFGPEYWLPTRDRQPAEFIDVFLSDPSLCRLYLGLSKLDPETAEELRKAVPMPRLRAFAHVLDFYGAMFEIRDGRAVVPGGARSARAWEDLVGVSPDRGAAFFEQLIARDDGWMASFFDALARIDGPVRDYLTEPDRMKRFYMAVRGRVTSPGPARPVFRANTDMLLLTTRLRLEPDGTPHIPGGIEVWKNLFINHPHGRYDGKLTRLASSWRDADDVLEALFALCRKVIENEPLKIFMTMSDLNRHRNTPLESATVDRLARDFRQYGAQYTVLSEVPTLSDQSIVQFLDAMTTLDRIRNNARRADAVGSMQALVSLWQILCRQGSIPPGRADRALWAILSPFHTARDSVEVFDAARAGVNALLQASGSSEGASPQERFLELLAGTATPTDAAAHNRLVDEMVRIFDSQRLVPLTTLFEVADHLANLGPGATANMALLNRLSSRIAEIQLPRAPLTTMERNALSFGYWTERHIQAQRRLNLRAVIDRAANDQERLREARGMLAPFLRDTLVGLNYLHYAPPGAQLIYANPLFVRSHDFIGLQGGSQTWKRASLFGSGWPSSAGGRLVGSLAGLPYALAEAEQNFMIPEREQALIWADLAPQMILSSKVPRWWNVTPTQMHWVALHIRHANSLFAEAAIDPDRRRQVMTVLERQATPARVSRVGRYLERGDVASAVSNVLPAEAFVLAREMLTAAPTPGPLAAEIRRLASEAPAEINYASVSRAFGTPKPTLTSSYRPELLHLRTFPTLMGYSSRIMAESWESSTLYWVALADAIHVPPGQLNILIPEWTRETLERIFATHLEDWPAVLRSLRNVGADVLQKARAEMATEQQASLD